MIYELIQNLHLLTMKFIYIFNLRLICILKYKTTNIRSGIYKSVISCRQPN